MFKDQSTTIQIKSWPGCLELKKASSGLLLSPSSMAIPSETQLWNYSMVLDSSPR